MHAYLGHSLIGQGDLLRSQAPEAPCGSLAAASFWSTGMVWPWARMAGTGLTEHIMTHGVCVGDLGTNKWSMVQCVRGEQCCAALVRPPHDVSKTVTFLSGAKGVHIKYR